MTMHAGPVLEEIDVGHEIPAIAKGPLSTAHVVRWSAAMENWAPIHYDWRYATQHDKLPDVLVNGSWKQHVMVQALTDWLGETGWLWKMSFQYRGMTIPGDTVTAWGRVTGKSQRANWGVVDLAIGLRDQKGVETSPGTASVVVPLRNGPKVPYPFDPRVLG
jgi:acyl dehydratase